MQKVTRELLLWYCQRSHGSNSKHLQKTPSPCWQGLLCLLDVLLTLFLESARSFCAEYFLVRWKNPCWYKCWGDLWSSSNRQGQTKDYCTGMWAVDKSFECLVCRYLEWNRDFSEICLGGLWPTVLHSPSPNLNSDKRLLWKGIYWHSGYLDIWECTLVDKFKSSFTQLITHFIGEISLEWSFSIFVAKNDKNQVKMESMGKGLTCILSKIVVWSTARIRIRVYFNSKILIKGLCCVIGACWRWALGVSCAPQETNVCNWQRWQKYSLMEHVWYDSTSKNWSGSKGSLFGFQPRWQSFSCWTGRWVIHGLKSQVSYITCRAVLQWCLVVPDDLLLLLGHQEIIGLAPNLGQTRIISWN